MLRYLATLVLELIKGISIFVLGACLFIFLFSIPDFLKGIQIAKKYAQEGLTLIPDSKRNPEKVSYLIQAPKFVPNVFSQYDRQKIFRDKDERDIANHLPVRLGVSVFNHWYNGDNLKSWDASHHYFRYFYNFYGPDLTPDILLSIPKPYWAQAVSMMVFEKVDAANSSLPDFIQKIPPEISPKLKNVFLIHWTGKMLNSEGFKGCFNIKFEPLFFEAAISVYEEFNEPQIANALKLGLQYYKIQKEEFVELEGSESEIEFVETFEVEIEKLCRTIVPAEMDFELSSKIEPYIQANIEEIFK